ncbi:MAG: hypothetical protein C0169_04385 [Thermodesulfobacterium geofontis]|uniref:Alginate export domain-containing protein n=1 Tax=Thermodesulfobacterium geofontis TaxID=1295609 RepID=A0A2N7QDP6_9BACT|nr:MAG: hypothetical protein C0169_04385 [Thermodesulfobacterium geofontis]
MRKLIFLFLIILFHFYKMGFALSVEHKPGIGIRLREETLDNYLFLKTAPLLSYWDDNSMLRFKITFWDKIKVNNNTSLYLRLSTEPRYYIGPHVVTLDETNNLKNFDQDELLIDNFYLEIKKPFNLPLDLKIGRQDFLGEDMYGEGFLIFDGTPGDGSRTFFFNAIRVRWLIKKDHTLDFVIISNPKTERYFPIIHPSYKDFTSEYLMLYYHGKKRLIATDEKGFMVYGRSKVFENLTLEPYYIFKEEESWGFNPNLHLHTFGIRGVFNWKSWGLRGEITTQSGRYSGTKDVSGLGGYIYFYRTFKELPFSPKFEIGYVYLSGDNPRTKKDEGFNTLFSKGPLINELYSYVILIENICKNGPFPGYWSNLRGFTLNFYLNPLKDLKIRLSYQKMWALRTPYFSLTAEQMAKDHEAALLKLFFDAMISGKGKDRGQGLTIEGSYKITPHITGLLKYEHFDPGDFYVSEARDAKFLRLQLEIKF